MNAQQIENLQTQNSKSEATGKVFFFTGLALLVINGVIALALAEPDVIGNMVPMIVVFMTVGGGLWADARKARQQD